MTRRGRAVLGALLFAGASHAACSASPPTTASPVAIPSAQPAPSFQTLRISNAGARSLEGLVVVFPDERVAFGDLAAGGTTPYRAFSKGVFRYAAYEHRVGATTISQPVTDWVGELPMPGQAFTYSIEAVDGPPRGLNIKLVSTTRDQ